MEGGPGGFDGSRDGRLAILSIHAMARYNRMRASDGKIDTITSEDWVLVKEFD